MVPLDSYSNSHPEAFPDIVIFTLKLGRMFFLPPGTLRNGIFPAISTNKGCHSQQWLQPCNVSQWAKEIQGWKEYLPSSSHQTAATPCGEPWGNSRCVQILAPDSWGAYQRNDFSEPRLLHLPIHRKALNSLTWGVWFSLINNNLLTFPTTCPLLQNSYTSWVLPSPPWSSFSELLEMLSPGMQSSFCPK